MGYPGAVQTQQFTFTEGVQAWQHARPGSGPGSFTGDGGNPPPAPLAVQDLALLLNSPLWTGWSAQTTAITGFGVQVQAVIIQQPGIVWTGIDAGMTASLLDDGMDAAFAEYLRNP